MEYSSCSATKSDPTTGNCACVAVFFTTTERDLHEEHKCCCGRKWS